jgi:large subunit ribosomal protein L5
MPAAAPTARLKTRYLEEIRPTLVGRFGYSSVMQAPRLEKITLNMGVGLAKQDSKMLKAARDQLATIAGQQPSVRRARKSIAAFKLREGMPVGVAVTLRAERGYEFLDRLVSIAIPRIRDFRGLNPRSFDGRGNYSLGVREQIIFPEVDYDAIDQVRGLDITITTTASTDIEAFALLSALGMPFAAQGRPPGFDADGSQAPEDSAEQPDTPAVAVEEPDTAAAAVEQPEAPAAAAEQPDTPALEQLDAPAAEVEQPDTPAAAVEQPDAPAPAKPAPKKRRAKRPSAKKADTAEQQTGEAPAAEQPGAPAAAAEQPDAPAPAKPAAKRRAKRTSAKKGDTAEPQAGDAPAGEQVPEVAGVEHNGVSSAEQSGVSAAEQNGVSSAEQNGVSSAEPNGDTAEKESTD